MITFDPFTSSLEAALADADPCAVTRWGGAQQLLARREFYEQHPLDGMAICATHDLVAPEWLARAFLRGFHAVVNCRSKSWDEAFGAPFPKGSNLARARQRRRMRHQIFVEVLDTLRADPTQAVADAVEKAGLRHGAGRTLADELYREAVAMHGFGAAGLKRAAMAQKRTTSQPARTRKLAGGAKRR